MGSNPIAPQKLTDMKTYKTTFGTIQAKRIVFVNSVGLLTVVHVAGSRSRLKNITKILGNGFPYIAYINYIDSQGKYRTALSYDVERLTLEKWIKQHEV